MRRYLAIAAVVVVLIGLAAVVYVIFFSGNGRETPTQSATGGAFGTNAGNAQPPAGGNAGEGNNTSGAGGVIAAGGRLVKIDAGPVAPGTLALFIPAASDTRSASSGAATASTTRERDVDIRYIARQSGNLYSYLFYAKLKTRLTNDTVPGIVSSVWKPDGAVAFGQYLSDASAGGQAATYAIPANGDKGFFLNSGIEELLALPKNLLALSSDAEGSVVSTFAYNGVKGARILTTPLADIRIAPAGASTLLVVTKPSGKASGYAYLVNEKTGAWTRVLGPLAGLSVLPSPSGAKMLVSHDGADGAPVLELYDVAKKSAAQLPIKTIADKCAWGATDSEAFCAVPLSLPRAVYPDDWYQGTISFSDRLWKIDATNRFADMIVDLPQLANGSVDAKALVTDSRDELLTFINKNDGALWAYDL